jgi:cytochrome c-type biogenesis protein CcmE
MKARHKRGLLIAVAVAILGIAATLVLKAFNSNMVFFFTPTQVMAHEVPNERAFRIGGLVQTGSLKRDGDGLTVHFVVTDTMKSVSVRYTGILPDLFKEGKGVVAQGKLSEDGIFVATEVLAKHDENYMPPDAAHAMEQAAKARATLQTN